ncbi:DUF222 domain-containing protein [Candidatus Poriferisocius sp.]|uniref:HNH endonuclease signature motif containing protein n=1 Tax=Candidatus Poriferisocius sp. TaxID=3101276 RepID=UPI003B01D7EA
MDLGVLTRGNSTKTKGESRGSGSATVDVQLAEFEGLGSGELVKLILQADSARRQLDGYLTALLGRFGDLEGQDAVEELCRQFGLGRHRARQQAKTSNSLKALPDTLEAAKQGWISIDHARVMGESHLRAPLSKDQELELVVVAISEDLDEFKKTVARSEDERRADDGLTRHERQRERRSGKVFDGDDDMVVLHAEFDRIAGERVKAALHDLSDRLFREDARSGSDRTHEQRNADALVALITQRPARADSSDVNSNGSGCCPVGDSDAVSSDDSEGHDVGSEIAPQATTLIVSVDYDTLSGQLKSAGLIDGTPIDIDDLRHIACDAGIVPAIFAADGQPLYMGRKQRAVTAAQKLALIARDKQCIGCGMRASACEAHHIVWWDDNGPTDITNLVLLCPKCHRKVHKHGYAVVEDAAGQNKLKSPHRAIDRDRARGPTEAVAA